MPAETQILRASFQGEALQERGVAIYDLGQTLVAIQMCIHKAHLAQTGTLEKGAYPVRDMRKLLSLQIDNRTRGSDIYALAPIIFDPVAREVLKQSVQLFLESMVAYAKGTVQAMLRQPVELGSGIAERGVENRRIYIGSIYAETVNIVDRVEGVGGCESIQLDSPALTQLEPVRLTKETKDYVHGLQSQYFLGAIQDLEGNVLYPNLRMVEIRRRGGKKCKVHLTEDDFDTVRYKQKRSSFVKFIGHPRYPLGYVRRSFDEFEAVSVQLTDGIM